VRRDLVEAIARINKKRNEAAEKARQKPPEPLRRISPNDLRRTYASWLKQRGVDSMVVAKLLGHTTSRMVELVYGHLNDAVMQAAVAQLPTFGPPIPPSVEPPGPSRARRRSRQVLSFAAKPANDTENTPSIGSQWVVKPGRNVIPLRPQRRKTLESSSEVAVPNPGIEPGTRGFSVRCSTS